MAGPLAALVLLGGLQAGADLPAATPPESADLAPAPTPPALPESVRDMLTTALAAHDDEAVESIARIARIRFPDSSDEIDRLVGSFRADENRYSALAQYQASEPLVRRLRVRALDLPPVNPRIWAAKLEVGGFRSTGGTDEVGVSLGFNGSYTIGRWQHKLRASLDYRRSNGATSQDYLLAAYEPRLRLSPASFLYALAQFERAPFTGYDDRVTASAGIGYTLVDRDRLKLSVDAGPSLRSVRYVDDGREQKLGLRSSLDLRWKVSDTVDVTQNSYGYVEADVGTLTLNNAINARVTGSLSARMSYNVQYESDDRLSTRTGQRKLDTLSKFSLVWGF
jgi:putative salt-induced outer membrane protein